MSEEKKEQKETEKAAQGAPEAGTPKPEAPKQEAPKQEAPKAEAPKQEPAKDAAAAAEAPKAETPKAEEKKAEKLKPVNCAVCNKSIKKKRYYYRNGKYFCTKRCWATTAKKDPKKAEAPQAES
jgi:ribonuclease E